MFVSGRRIAASIALCASSALIAQAQPAAPRVSIETSEGAVVVELYPHFAPEAVARFLMRSGITSEPHTITPVRYRGTQVCELRAHGFLVFGCQTPPAESPKPSASGDEPPLPDEIDAVAMGLAERGLGDTRERDLLWQLEVYPRYQHLRTHGQLVPPGLAELMAGLRRRGMAATVGLEGKSRLWYLEALGYHYREGASPLGVSRGVLASASRWPGEADERFLIPLTDMPEWDGRATVFGRVVSGWDTLERIARRAVDKSHVPLEPITILDVVAVERGQPDVDQGERDS